MRRPGRLADALASGELSRLAHGCVAERELAGRLGLTYNAYACQKSELKKRGIKVPGLAELADGVAPMPEATANDNRWPNLTAFDEEVPPLPVMPEGHLARGISTLVDAEGNIKQQWIKTRRDDDDLLGPLLKAIERIADGWPTRAELTAPPVHDNDDLLCVYPMGDPHIGLLAWREECGENFDLEIAEQLLVTAADHLVSLAPPAKRAIVATVGDTFHSDGFANATTKGTRVDVDGRIAKVLSVGIRTFRRIIDRALERHDHVEVKVVPGNHDALLSLVLSVALQQFYEREPRIHIDPSPEDFLWYRFGANLLGFNHGHRVKPMDLLGVMAVDCAKDWGETRHRRIYRGHVHHETVKEVPGVVIESLNTLAGSDDWHRRQGYRASRHMRMDVIHRERGLVNRHIVGVEQLR